MGERGFRIIDRDGGHGSTVIATGPDRAEALEAALDGILAAAGNDRPSDASVAIPLRAERSDLAALVRALAAQLADEAREAGGALGGIRLDGLLRTDDGLTAWGYAFVAPGVDTALDVPEVAGIAVSEEPGQTTITATLEAAPAVPTP